jgi:predicted RNA-binding Zn-ribbon protein involved in translation (DUF1610 family)
MDQPNEACVLDGNAVGGLLCDLFACDVTTAEVTCGSCGVAAEIGGTRVYGGTMGAIFRCPHCGSIVMRLVQTPAGTWLDMRGSRCLFARSSA